MRLKLFRAPDMAGAMRRVRAEMGPEALILSSRRVAEGVEVTAALDHAEPQAAEPAPAAAPAPPSAPPLAPEAAPQVAALAFHGAPPALRRQLAAGPLAFALSAVLRFTALPLGPDGPPILLAGPAGAGKTLSTVRLATRLVMAGTAPMVVTADGQRAGATEQLAAFTRVLGVNLLVASQPAGLRRALAGRRPGAPMLVDAPGLDLFDPAECRQLVDLAGAIGARIALVLPAGLDPSEAADIAAAHRVLGAELLIATRLDTARRIGAILAAAHAGLALAEAGTGPGAADGMVPMTPELLARRLMKAPRATPPAPEAAA
jgi:flagellar biosynthesis protein FlhF